MRQSTVKLTPKFLLGGDLKKRSKWSSSLVERKAKRIQDNIDLSIDLRLSDTPNPRTPYFRGGEDFFERRSEDILKMETEKTYLKTSKDQLLSDIRAITLSIAPYSQVREIPKGLLDETIRDERYEYFKAEFGMNINVPEGKVNQIRFYLTMLADGIGSEKAQVVSGFPNDLIQRVNVIGGSVKIGINNLLNIIPEPFVQTLGNFIQIDLNPWSFRWGYNRVKVLFSEGNNHKVNWFLSSKNLNQSFSCSITLKKRKTVKEVIGHAYAVWEYQPPKELKDIAKRLVGIKNIKLGSDEKKINIIA